MCGMELVARKNEYHRNNNKKTMITETTNKKFCDKRCYGYFMKRVWADEMGIKLDE